MSLPTDVFKPLRAALGAGRIEDVLACLDPDGTVVVQLGEESIVLNGDLLRSSVQDFLSAFESPSLTAISRTLSSSSIAEEAVFSADHVGPWVGIEPTHRRVRFNVRLIGEPAGPGPLHELWIEPDQHALLAQIADRDDILGMTGGLVAAVRERDERPVWVSGDSSDGSDASAAGSGRDRSKAHLMRRGSVVAACLLLIGAIAGVGFHLASPSGTPSADAAALVLATPSTKPSQTASPTSRQPVRPLPKKVAPKTQAVIHTASPQSVPQVQAGRQLVLSSDVLFGLASSKVTPGARTVLLGIARQVRAARVTGTIQVNGYTDATGASTRNVTLSRSRALAVARVLQPALSGLSITLAPQGFGERNPIASNSKPVGQARNRRVTIVLPKR